ncbi:MAG: diguanylate cyclase [Patescibacteria group bacterium]
MVAYPIVDELEEKESEANTGAFTRWAVVFCAIGTILLAAVWSLGSPGVRAAFGGLVLVCLALTFVDGMIVSTRLIPFPVRLALFHLANLAGITAALFLGGNPAFPLFILYGLEIVGACLFCRLYLAVAVSLLATIISAVLIASGRFTPSAVAIPFSLALTIFCLGAAALLGLLSAHAERNLRRKLAATIARLRNVQADQEKQLSQLTEIHLLLEERYAEIYAMYLIGQEVSSELAPETIVAKVVDILLGLLGAKSCSIYLLDPDGPYLRQQARAGGGQEIETFPLFGNLLARCWEGNLILSYEDLGEDEKVFWAKRGVNGLFCAPLWSKGKREGLLLVEYDHLPSSMEEHRRLLSTVSGQISLALENAKLNREIRYMATHDALTGLWNRHYFQERFALELERAGNERPLSVLLLDIDHFKRINDSFGHEAGDELLQRLAQTLKADAGEEMALARFGGDEFVLLMPDTGLGEASRYAEATRARMAGASYTRGQAVVSITASLGVASYPHHTADPSQLLQKADEGLYHAKRAGRNRVGIAPTHLP